MAYTLLYGDGILYDPYTESTVTEAKFTAKSNNPDYLDFEMPVTHALYDEVRERGELVTLMWDETVLFVGEVEGIDTDFYGTKSVSCVGGLSWLKDTVVRPYSTVATEEGLDAPATVDGLFAWYIDQHNSHAKDSRRTFAVGQNQGAALDKNNYIYRSSTQKPTTWDEIESKILDTLGGYVTVDYDPLTINLWADIHEQNAQVIDLGVNITDLDFASDTADLYTAVRPEGGKPDGEDNAVDVSGLADGAVKGFNGIYKSGDVVYCPDAVTKYGYRETAWTDDDCLTASGLLESAARHLNAVMQPSTTVTVKAVDLALVNKKYEHLKVGHAVRVRSAFHGIDEYLVVTSAEIDLQDPGNTEFELGTGINTATGIQSTYVAALTGNINRALDKADAAAESAEGKLDKTEAADTYATIAALGVTDGKADAAQSTADAASATADTASSTAKAAQTTATNAASTASTASTTAKAAQTTATAAKDTADAASATATTAKETADTAASTASTAKDTADAASATAATAKDTADAAQATADAAQAATDTLQTLIRETSDGIEVGKSADGSTYSGTHTLVGTDAFKVHDKKHNTLASFGATSATIGNGATLATLQVGKLLSIKSYNSESYIITGASGYSDLHIGAIDSADNFAGPQVALLKDANAVAAHADRYYFYGGTTSLYPAMFTWEQFRKKLLTHTYVGSMVVKLNAVDSTHATAVLFSASGYKAITGVAFDQKKHSITCMNGEHDACANIWSMVASYSASDGSIHLMCMTSAKVSSIVRVNYTITIDAS